MEPEEEEDSGVVGEEEQEPKGEGEVESEVVEMEEGKEIIPLPHAPILRPPALEVKGTHVTQEPEGDGREEMSMLPGQGSLALRKEDWLNQLLVPIKGSIHGYTFSQIDLFKNIASFSVFSVLTGV